jgi:hypothetical protein
VTYRLRDIDEPLVPAKARPEPSYEHEPIHQGQPWAPQLLARLEGAKGRMAGLEDTARALSLDAQLDRHDARARLGQVESDLAAARVEVQRLQQAYSQALARDARKRAELEVGALKAAMSQYEGFAFARIAAVRDLEKSTKAATEAARRFLAATSLLQEGVLGHGLPRGLLLGRDLEMTMGAVEGETNAAVEHVRRLVNMTVASKLDQDIEGHDD